MRLELAPLLIVATACSSVPRPPPCRVENEWGLVRASTPAAAERLSEHLLWLAPRITAAVPGLSSRSVDARFVGGIHLEGISPDFAKWVEGATIDIGRERWIELPEGDDALKERRTLAHELIHFWIGPDWSTLPYFLEEGLAENVRESLVPAGYGRDSLERALILGTTLFGGLVLDSGGRPVRCGSFDDLKEKGLSLRFLIPYYTDRSKLPTVRDTLAVRADALRTVQDPEKYAVMFCYGYLLVARIGVERLHALCLRARAAGRRCVPTEWALEAAGLPEGDTEAWSRAIVEMAVRR